MVGSQGIIFTIFVIDGIVIGILFDIFRVLRKSFKTKDFVTYIEDIFFWILVGILIIYTMYNYCDGELRMFMVLGIALGILLYIVMLSKYFVRISTKIINIIKKIIIIPLKFIFNIIVLIINKIKKYIKIEKNIKIRNKIRGFFGKKEKYKSIEIKRKNGDI